VDQAKAEPSDVEAHPTCLIDISTGTHATQEVDDSLYTAVDEGGNIYGKFVNSAFFVD
jgi:hypothetical protein